MNKNTVRRTLAGMLAGAAIAASAVAAGAPAHAGPTCGAPGLAPCAPPPDPAVLCAVIAWRTWTPCNWYGVQVPQGTPGSL